MGRVLPNLVVLDWMLPGESDIQFAQRWRRDASTRDLPIVKAGYRLANPARPGV